MGVSRGVPETDMRVVSREVKPLKGRPCVPKPHAHFQPSALRPSRFGFEAALSVPAVTSGRVSCCPKRLGRCRANSAQTRQSRPDFGFGWSHFSGKRLEPLSSGFLLARKRVPKKKKKGVLQREIESESETEREREREAHRGCARGRRALVRVFVCEAHASPRVQRLV